MNNHYKTLGLAETATQDEIKKAYRKLAKKFHPDANPGNKKAEVVFKEINEAYEILSDENKKAEYDQRLSGGSAYDSGVFGKGGSQTGSNTARRTKTNVSASDFAKTNDIFEDFFGFDPKSSSPNLRTANEKIKPVKTKDAFDAIFGKRKF